MPNRIIRNSARSSMVMGLLATLLVAGCNGDFWYVPMITVGAKLTRLSNIDPESPTFQVETCDSFKGTDVPTIFIYGYSNHTATVTISDASGKVVKKDDFKINDDQSYYWHGYTELSPGSYKIEVAMKSNTILKQNFVVAK